MQEEVPTTTIPPSKRARMATFAPSWDSGFRELMSRKIISGYGLITAGSCQIAAGNIAELLGGPDQPAEQFSQLFQASEAYPTRVTLPGNTLYIIRKTEADAYAIGRRNRLSLCINNLPFGIVISAFKQPNLPAVVIPLVEKQAQELRK
jgi:hypothetical protein